MDNYTIKLYSRAVKDLEEIYSYIAKNLSQPGTAEGMVEDLENAIYSLKTMPERCPLRQIGAYSNGTYRHLLVKNYVVIFKVLPEIRQVHIVTVRYAKMKN